MIKVLFFAQTRELVGVDSVDLDMDFATVEDIRAHLATQEGKWIWHLSQASCLLPSTKISCLSIPL
ncbi:molybdenum cofactor biosynthesis protein MoaD [Vibrio maritimus]|uniref:Molybdenum cofactor biosynthesis protein MoaD n=1 Tax=Vibrio maritimus TaxID=990268 RepID=A0A090S2B0_9VIBR|nr:molybdenum cofactor biosynthesis protein MoaD [Vibrio maritimus]